MDNLSTRWKNALASSKDLIIDLSSGNACDSKCIDALISELKVLKSIWKTASLNNFDKYRILQNCVLKFDPELLKNFSDHLVEIAEPDPLARLLVQTPDPFRHFLLKNECGEVLKNLSLLSKHHYIWVNSCRSRVKHLYPTVQWANRDEVNAFSSALSWQFPALTSLSLNKSSIDDESLKILLTQCPALNELNLLMCKNITEEGITFLAHTCSSLKSLKLPSHLFKDRIIEVLTDGFTTFTSLELQRKSISEEKILRLVDRNTSLTSLRLYQMAVTDEGIRHLTDSATALTSLNLCSCQHITDRAVQYLADKNTTLTSLDLSDTKITDQGIHYLADRNTTLTSLNLFSCKNITDRAVQYLADKNTILTSLDLSKTKITDQGIHYLADKNTTLTFLDLSETKITDQGIHYLAEKATALTSLDLYDAAVTEQGVRHLADRFKTLRIGSDHLDSPTDRSN